MVQAITSILSSVAGWLTAMLAAGFLLSAAVWLGHSFPAASLLRLKRSTLAILAILAVVATIEAQKRTGGDAASGSPSTQNGTGPGEHQSAPPTNTLHFADISVGTNTIALTLAWPPGLFSAGTIIDLFAATSLVDVVWSWQGEHTIAADETNWMATVARDGAVCFFHAAERADPGDLRDTDGDGIPDVYELHNGTNPYIADYEDAPKIVAGGTGMDGVTDLAAAFAASEPFSIIEVASGIHSGSGWTDLHLPDYPVLVTSPDGGRDRTVILRHTRQAAAFYLSATQRTDTVVQGLGIDLVATNGQQMGFWCGGDRPLSGAPAAGTFRNISIRMPNPGVQYFGWLFRHWESNEAVIAACTLNAFGATKVRGIYAIDSPPMSVENCTFANFPPGEGATLGYGIQYETTPANWSHAPDTIPLEIVNCLFDASFTNAYALAPLMQGVAYDVTMMNCIVPSPLAYLPDHEYGTLITNAMTSWSGHLLSGSPAIDAGTDVLRSSFDIDGQLRDSSPDIGADEYVPDAAQDTDGDGLSDLAEKTDYGTDPHRADSDCDGMSDADEIAAGTDPQDPHSFTQKITATVTNTVSLVHPLYVAWGNSGTGWETNGLASFPGGYGTTNYFDVSSQGATHVKAYCDLNGNGEYDASYDILLVRTIPYGSSTRMEFVFGDVDGDGVPDPQERADGTDPYDRMNFHLAATVMCKSSDVVSGITNYVAWGFSETGWETNGLTSFAGSELAFPVAFTVTNGELFAKAFRDFNANGVYDEDTDILVTCRLSSADNGRSVDFWLGDSDRDGVPDSVELDKGTDPVNGLNYCFTMSVTVTGIFQTTNRLTMAATFGGTVLCSPLVMVTNVWSADFGHLLATNGERVVLTFWDDANSNGVHDITVAFSQCSHSLTNHMNDCVLKLQYGTFDANGNNLPDWWEVTTGLADLSEPHGEFDDTDGDGIINLHEYWAGCNPLVPDGSNTLLSVMARSIDDRIRGKTASVMTKARFLNYPVDSVSSGFQPNTNCWAYGIDLSCASPWNSWRGSIQAGTAITKRHLLFAKHYLWSSNGEIYFHDVNGNIHTNRLIDRNFSLQTDIAIGLLQSDLTDSVHPARILPPSCESVIGDGRGLPVLSLDQEEHALVHDIGNLDENVNGIYPVSSNRYEFAETVIVGDSGNPRFLVVSNEVILLNAFYGGGAGSGPSISFYKAHVQHLMDELSLSHGLDTNLYQLVEFPIE